jgi:hypothetical protein
MARTHTYTILYDGETDRACIFINIHTATELKTEPSKVVYKK